MKQWQEMIVSTPDVLRGKPRFIQTRIPVALILGYLASNASPGEIIAEFSGFDARAHFSRSRLRSSARQGLSRCTS